MVSSSDSGRITKDSTVMLNFALRLQDGSEIDSNLDAAPCRFRYGDGSLLPGFEQSLLGLSAGDRQVIELAADQAFGEWQEDRELRFPRHRFKELELEPGLVISFADAEGEKPGVVRSVDGDMVTVDFNHPLAGRPVLFEVCIHSVEQGT